MQSTSAHQFENGYVAIASVLVISVVILIIGTTASLLSVNEIQSSLSHKQNEVAVNSVEACVEEALLQLNSTNTLPSTVTLPTGTCSVTLNSQAGNNWTFTTSGSFGNYTKSFQIDATRSTFVNVTRWVQL